MTAKVFSLAARFDTLAWGTMLGLTLVFSSAAADTVKLGGTGAALGTMRILTAEARKNNPDMAFEVLPSLGSGGGLKAVQRGSIEIALIARELTPDEMAKGLTAFEYGATPFVLGSAKPYVGSLALQQIADIYSGKTITWPDGTPVRLILRPRLDTDTTALAAIAPAIKDGVTKALAREGMIVANTDQEAASEIERLPGAIGTTTLALIRAEQRNLVAIPIEGIAPTAATLADGRYKHVRRLYMVTKGTPTSEVARFIRFVRSPEGERILGELGYVVPKTQRAAR